MDAGDLDSMMVRLDSPGNQTWHTFLGGGAQEWCYTIAVDTDGLIHVAGESNGSWGSPVRAFAGGNEGFVAQIVLGDVHQTIGIDVENGWNFISVPVTIGDSAAAEVFDGIAHG